MSNIEKAERLGKRLAYWVGEFAKIPCASEFVKELPSEIQHMNDESLNFKIEGFNARQMTLDKQEKEIKEKERQKNEKERLEREKREREAQSKAEGERKKRLEAERKLKEHEQGNSSLGVFMPRIISMWEHSALGNSINWIYWDKLKVYGHLTPTPKEGDILRAKMESGKIARFEFKEVNVMRDPCDQFFATVSYLEYES